jgi:hypothetical protein
MTDSTTNVPEPQNAAEEQVDFRSQLTPEGRAALDELAPELAEKLIQDESLLAVPDQDNTETDVIVLEEIVFEHPSQREAPKGFLARAKHTVSAVVSDPKGALEDFKTALPEKIEKLDANIAKLDTRLNEEQAIIDNESKIAAELETVLEHLKSQLTDKSALGDTIAQIEKKLKYHKARVAIRTVAVPALRKTLQTQSALRAQFTKLINK